MESRGEENKGEKIYTVNRDAPVFDPMDSDTQQAISLFKFEEIANYIDMPLDILEKVESGNRDSQLTRIAGKLVWEKKPLKETVEYCHYINTTRFNPPLSRKDVIKICKSVYKGHVEKGGGLGFDDLSGRIQKTSDINNDFVPLTRYIANAIDKNTIAPFQVAILSAKLKEKSKFPLKTIKAAISDATEQAGKIAEGKQDQTIKEQLPALKQRFTHFAYVSKFDKIWNLHTGDIYTVESFNRTYPNVIEGGNANTGNTFNILNRYDVIKRVSRTEFDPEFPITYTRDGISYANTYIKPKIKSKKGDVRILLDHFKYIFPSRRDRRIFLDFIAHLVQYPEKKIRWMLIIKSTKGVGKTVIGEQVLMPLLGEENVGKVGSKLIASDFNGMFIDKLLLIFEELNTGKDKNIKKERTDMLKEVISDSKILAHKKGLEAYTTKNKTNSLAFTNEVDPVAITQDERRFCMLVSEAFKRGSRYYNELVNFCEHNLPAIHYYFNNRKIGTYFNISDAPYTLQTEELKRRSMHWPADTLQDIIEGQYKKYSSHGIMSLSIIKSILKEEATGSHKFECEQLDANNSAMTKRLTIAMIEAGFRKIDNPNSKDNRFTINRDKTSVFQIPGRIHETNSRKVEVNAIPSVLAKVKFVSSTETEAKEDMGEVEKFDE